MPFDAISAWNIRHHLSLCRNGNLNQQPKPEFLDKTGSRKSDSFTAMNKPCVHYLDPVRWTGPVVAAIMHAVKKTWSASGSCSIMLTGGRSAERLYRAWAASPEFSRLSNVQFYFGDERCVPPDHSDSNYGLVMRTLFQHGVPPACRVIRIEAEQANCGAVGSAYEAQLPERLDVLLLSVGEDGHIASLFPHSTALFETHRRVVPVTSPKPPIHRLTITPSTIQDAREVFVLCLGKQKRTVYKKALHTPSDISAIPARLVLSRTWIFGD